MADLVLLAPRIETRPAMRWRSLLDGAWYTFRLVFNTRARRWTLDLENDDATPVITGIRVVDGVDLLAPHRWRPGVPPGQLFATDVTGQHTEPGRRDFAGRIGLTYRPEADVAALEGTEGEVF